MRIISVILFLLVWTLTSAYADVVEIPLPELHGVYPITGSNCERTTSFSLPQPPLRVNGAWFRISGTTEVGQVTCEWGGPYPWPMDFFASMKDTVFAHFWLAYEFMPEVAGPFGWTAEFQPSPHTTTWGFLMDGEGEMTLCGAPMPLVLLCRGIPPSPTATVVEAVLMLSVSLSISEITDFSSNIIIEGTG